MNELIEKLRHYIKEKNADALLINSTNEFLVEYNNLEDNSRYKVTGFSGSTGDALLTLDNLYLFVDGRYHEQADLEVNHNEVTVVKVQINETYIKKLVGIIPENSKILVISSKISRSFCGNLHVELEKKNTKILLTKTDPVEYMTSNDKPKVQKYAESIPESIAGLSVRDKIEKFVSDCNENDYLLITSLQDIAYITNLRAFDIKYSSSFPAKLVLNKQKNHLFTDYKVTFKDNYIKICPLQDFDKFIKKLKKKDIYLDKYITMKDYLLIDRTNSTKPHDLQGCKTIKNEAEIRHYKDSCKKTDLALSIVEKMLDSDIIYSEYDYYKALKESFYKNGAIALSFKPIVASGKNSSITHYSKPNEKTFINDGDWLLVDCGGYYEGGYATDITRTFVKGTPAAEQKKVYTIVLKAFLNTYKKNYSQKSTWFDIDKTARDVISKANIEGYLFNHSTGHGLGISVHESPPSISTSETSKTSIYKNAVFTIEPGIYKENSGGVRLENSVFVKDTENNILIESLTHYKFDEKLIDFELLNENEKLWLKEWQDYYAENYQCE